MDISQVQRHVITIVLFFVVLDCEWMGTVLGLNKNKHFWSLFHYELNPRVETSSLRSDSDNLSEGWHISSVC